MKGRDEGGRKTKIMAKGRRADQKSRWQKVRFQDSGLDHSWWEATETQVQEGKPGMVM